ncbi:MAG: endo-1,4-beta-xylanase [Defluviitaleaceae bacterium]|nr:endo-1,4-beta-xylanase [Defluviitaleaceae bacterium]MCL2239140.1 endo-1,4-beta-xylanase [Defluviitaleaceae bacterium]
MFLHRMGTKTVKIEGSGSVSVKMLRHKFLFGCSEFSTLPYAAGEMDAKAAAIAEKRYSHLTELLNFVTLPFYWGRYEPTQGKPDAVRMEAAARYLKKQGVTLKGHPLCWHTVCADWLMAMDNETVLKIQLERIHRDISAFAGLIDMWDVINEAVIMPLFDKYDNAITRLCKERGRIKLIRDLFAQARAASGNATLLINDFETSESYDILVEGLLEAGVPIDAIGIQSHMHQGYWGVEKTQEILARFARFGLPLHFTEVSLVSGEIMPREIVDLNDYKVDAWPSTPECEARQAAEAVAFYETLFTHPLVTSITWWSFQDGLWLGAPSGLLDKNSDPKPAYHALHKKIKGEWWTGEQSFTPDANGTITVTGYKGDYVAACNGKETLFTID